MHLLNKRNLITALVAFASLVAMAQKTVKGTVKDSSGEPLIGVSVAINGKSVAVTDLDGRFSIPSVRSSDKIEFSYVGYQPQTVTVGQKTQIDITLRDDAQMLK